MRIGIGEQAGEENQEKSVNLGPRDSTTGNSRARGDHGPKSDYDLAVWWNDCAGESWSDFAGIIQSFAFTYELTWKTLKLILEQNGIAAPFPRVAFEEAFKRDMIEGNEIWKDIIEARNLSSHTHDQALVRKLYADINDRYVEIFVKTAERMKPFVEDQGA